MLVSPFARRMALVCLLTLPLPGILLGCSGPKPAAEAPADSTAAPEASGSGTLAIHANGEDFVRQGFVTKDGWQISFDHIYATLGSVTAYQSDPPYDPQDPSAELKAVEQVSLDQPMTVDLAAGDETADPVKVSEVTAPAGRYNALSWQLVGAPEGPAAGYPLVLQGTATKDGQTLPFTLKLSQELAFTCGDFVGEERKGILAAGGTADLEATFHFDHLFGDGSAPADDEINTGALGFDPIAALAQNGEVVADSEALKQAMEPAAYQKMQEILPSLGHVGEGHCKETKLSS